MCAYLLSVCSEGRRGAGVQLRAKCRTFTGGEKKSDGDKQELGGGGHKLDFLKIVGFAEGCFS